MVLGVVRSEMATDFGSKEVELMLMRGYPWTAHTLFLGLLKTVPTFVLDRKCPCVIWINFLKMNGLNCVENEMLMHAN